MAAQPRCRGAGPGSSRGGAQTQKRPVTEAGPRTELGSEFPESTGPGSAYGKWLRPTEISTATIANTNELRLTEADAVAYGGGRVCGAVTVKA